MKKYVPKDAVCQVLQLQKPSSPFVEVPTDDASVLREKESFHIDFRDKFGEDEQRNTPRTRS